MNSWVSWTIIIMFGNCGAQLTVLTMQGETTNLGGHFDNEQELNQLLEML